MRRVRRRSVVRRRKTRIMMPKSMMPETKYATYIDISKSIKNNFFSTPVATLDGINNFYSDFFSSITKGTDDSQRVGDRIFVKFITIQLLIQGCGDIVSPDNVYNFLVRVLIHNGRFTAGTTLNNFFRGTSASPITHLKPDRRNVTVWHDKTHLMTNGNGLNGVNKGAGAMKLIKIKLPVYRNINYDSTGLSKDDNDVYSLSVAAYNMAGAAGFLKQCACMDLCIRTYFTDA